MSASAPQVIQAGAAPQVTYAAAPQYMYAQAPSAAPTVTYMTSPATYAAAPQVTYASPGVYSTGAAPASYVAAAGAPPMEPATYAGGVPTSYAMPQATYMSASPTYSAYTQVSQAQAPQQLPQAASMVYYPGMAQSYFPTSVQAAWEHHYNAHHEQNLDKLMLDYDETSIIRVYINGTGEKREYRGTAQIREFFQGMFGEMQNRSDARVLVTDIDEEARSVFFVWECPASGFRTATDTCVFGPDFKIKRQNKVYTKGPAAAGGPAGAITSATAAGGASPKSAKASSKKSSKKKSKGCC